MKQLVKRVRPPQPMSLSKFYEKRNKILIIRDTGGLGDILMHRMIFEDFKSVIPEAELIFACPPQYHPAVEDHPFLDQILDCRKVALKDYVISYNTTSACSRYEMAIAPLSNKHRSDIWADHCGVELTNHNMHLNLDENVKCKGAEVINKIKNNKPTVVIAPISAMVSKNLSINQLAPVVEWLKKEGFSVAITHNMPIPEFQELNIPMFVNSDIKLWMGVINASDYVLSVDTSTFHLAGGLDKPVVGVFTFADGKVYGKYYPKFELVQKHRDDGWDCGPCYYWTTCCKTKKALKPCLTEISSEMIINGFKRLVSRFPINN